MSTAAPILLTYPGELPAVTAEALEDLGVSNVVILGGELAVSSAVETAVEGIVDTVERVGGADAVPSSAWPTPGPDG